MHSELTQVLTQLVVVLGAGAIAAIVFQRARLPIVLGYVLAGLLIGPSLSAVVDDPSLVHTLSDLGVILLFFTIGLEFSVRTIARVGLPTLLTAIVELSVVAIVMFEIGRALGWTETEAVFVAIGAAIASTMLVVKGVETLGLTGPGVDLMFALLVVEDLLSILLLAILTGVATGHGISADQLGGMVLRLAGFLVLMIVLGMLVVPRAIRWVAAQGRSELLLIASLAVCFGMDWVAVHAGYSLALGAFVAGSLIAESGKGHEVDALVRPFRDLFAAVFFVAIGMTIAPGEIIAHWPSVLVVAVALIVAKTCGVTIAAFFTGNGLPRSVQTGLALSQIGEFAFIVVALGVATEVVRPFLLPVVVAASCITAITGTFQLRAGRRAASWLDAHLPAPVATFVSFYESWIARLRAAPRPESIWPKLRRPLVLIVLDTVLLAATVLAAAGTHRRIEYWLAARTGLDERVAFGLVVAAAIVLSALFALGIARGAVRLSWLLATTVIPEGPTTGTVPRRALLLTLELGIVLVLGLPVAATIQPFVPGGGVVVLVIIAILALATRRSIENFAKHVRAGSSLIVEVLGRQGEPGAHQLRDVQAVLPGFDGLTPVSLVEDSPATGKSLAEIDLRARTGATVLAISRHGGGTANPSPKDPLRAGDVLALAGSTEAVAEARKLLVGA